MSPASHPASGWDGGAAEAKGRGVQTQREHSVELKVHLSKNKTRSQVRKGGGWKFMRVDVWEERLWNRTVRSLYTGPKTRSRINANKAVRQAGSAYHAQSCLLKKTTPAISSQSWFESERLRLCVCVFGLSTGERCSWRGGGPCRRGWVSARPTPTSGAQGLQVWG